MNLDALDQALLGELRRDARQSMRTLAGKLGCSTPTAAARVRRLEQAGVILAYRVETSTPDGSQVALVHADPALAQALLIRLQAIQGIQRVTVLAGGPALVFLQPEAIAALGAAVARSPGASYSVYPILGAREAAKTPVVEAPCHLCGGPIQGKPLVAVLAGRRHVFCCAQCKSAFVARHEQLSKGQSLPIVKASPHKAP